jgi:hypothetical protein
MRPYATMSDGGGPDESDTRMLRRAGIISKEEQDVRNALAAVQADTGVEQALAIIAAAQANLNPPRIEDPIPVKNLVAQNQPAPSPVYAIPLTPTPATYAASSIAKTVTAPIKTATPDIILFDDSLVPVEVMTDLIFEDIGGQELINISRTDTINGQKILYQPIKNINIINQEYNPNNILGLQKTSDKYFSGYAIKFEERVPKVSNSLDGNPVYVDSSGNLVVDSINLNADEQVEIQVTVSGTIYEAEFGVTIS